MSKAKKVLIYSDTNQMGELYTAAKAIGEEVVSFYIGDKAGAVGADTVYYLGNLEDGKMHESYIQSILKLIDEISVDVVLFSTSVRCRMMAAVIAAKHETSVLTDASTLKFEDSLLSSRMVYGGAAYKTEKAKSFAVACVSAGSYEASALPEASVVDVVSDCESGIVCTGKQIKVKDTVNLAVAKKVVCVGRGAAKEESFAMANDLAHAIGAEVACTRPIADDGIMPTAAYVGISGVMMKPDVYIGLGISGQVQHMVGISSSKTMFIINKDKNAPFFKNADFGLVADVEKVLPKINEILGGYVK